MAFDPLSAVLDIGGKVIDRLWPDPAQAAQAKLDLAKMAQDGNLKELEVAADIAQGQMEINKMEAQHGGWFKGGWRPAVGWICALAMGYKFLVYPFLIFIIQSAAHFIPDVEMIPLKSLPVIEWAELSIVLMGMLGLGTMRSYEKRKTQIGK